MDGLQIFLGRECGLQSITVVLDQSILWDISHTCFAIADLSVSPFLMASLCCWSLVNNHNPVSRCEHWDSIFMVLSTQHQIVFVDEYGP